MISIEVRENESVDRVLKRFRKKFERACILREFRRRSSYVKPSINRRYTKLRAIYRQKMMDDLQ